MSKKLKGILSFIAFIATGVIGVLTLFKDVGVPTGIPAVVISSLIINIFVGLLLVGIFVLTLINTYIRKTKIAWITALEKAMEIMTYLLFAMFFVMHFSVGGAMTVDSSVIIGMVNVLLMLFVVAVKLINCYVPEKAEKAKPAVEKNTEKKAEEVVATESVEEVAPVQETPEVKAEKKANAQEEARKQMEAKIAQLEELKSKGLITEEEYDKGVEDAVKAFPIM